MKNVLWLVVFSFLLGFGCTKSKSETDEINEYVQKYLYAIRDAVDHKKGSVKEIYDTMLSKEMKESVSLDEYKDWLTERYKGKIGRKLRTARATIGRDKATGKTLEATATTSNEGRMAGIMNKDQSLIYEVRLIKENGQWKVEQQELMAQIQQDRAEKERLNDLLKNYKGLVKIEEITGKWVPGKKDKGVAELRGIILNASEDLDIVRAGIKVFFKDSSGDIIYAAKFTPVIDMRYEGLRTSLLPGRAKSFTTRLKDIPSSWDPDQPLAFRFYLIDGNVITKEELAKEYKDRAKLKKLIEDTKRADEEARKQLKEMWEREKALKAKIKEMQNNAKKAK